MTTCISALSIPGTALAVLGSDVMCLLDPFGQARSTTNTIVVIEHRLSCLDTTRENIHLVSTAITRAAEAPQRDRARRELERVQLPIQEADGNTSLSHLTKTQEPDVTWHESD